MTDAFDRWIEAIHHPDDETRLRAAVTETIVVRRHDPAPRGSVGALGATLEGIANIGAWLRMAPPGGVFSLATSPRAEGSSWHVEYGYRIETLVNGGIWIAWLEGHRIAVLTHQPFALLASQ
ncbi:MAG: hypothetical protein SFX73_09415 [Kofleriaceae bacterium]|nr:hypothetical protein [Kofleriaceae bacterium]